MNFESGLDDTARDVVWIFGDVDEVLAHDVEIMFCFGIGRDKESLVSSVFCVAQNVVANCFGEVLGCCAVDCSITHDEKLETMESGPLFM